MAALIRGNRDALHVLLERGGDDLLGRAVVAEVDDLAAARLQDAANDVDGGVVAVEQRRRRDEADLVFRLVFGALRPCAQVCHGCPGRSSPAEEKSLRDVNVNVKKFRPDPESAHCVQTAAWRSLNALTTTDTELALIAAAAIIGLRRSPVHGNSTPAAIGTPSTLYTKARNRFWRILRMVARESRRARTMPRKSPFTSVMPALWIATSAPVPIAIPTSACASAGASFTPSPAIATARPCARSALTTSPFCCGSTSARTSAMPRRPATAMAVTSLS